MEGASGVALRKRRVKKEPPTPGHAHCGSLKTGGKPIILDFAIDITRIRLDGKSYVIIIRGTKIYF